jgi:hypothetical protein
MSTATRHIETDPLAALREELMRADVRGAARRPSRRALIVVAIVVGLLAATAATAALTNFTTGVAEVDELLEIEHGSHPGRLPAGRGTDPVPVRIGDGTYQVVAYMNRRGEVATATAERHRGGVRGTFNGGGPRAADLARTLERRGTILEGSSHGPEQRVYWGYADGTVESVRVKGPGDWIVKMSPPWTPPVAGGRPLRVLVVIDERDIDVGDDGLQPNELSKVEGLPPQLEPVYAK